MGEIAVKDLLFDPAMEREWIETFLTIPNELGQTVEFKLTAQQQLMQTYHTGRDITVKGRQTRASSDIMARNVRRMTTAFGLNCVVVTQTDEMTQMFRARIKHHLVDLANANMEFDWGIDNDYELVIGQRMKNRFIWASAQQQAGKRGVQTAHIVHASEVAHWPAGRDRLIIGGLLPACPPPPYGWFDIESTPNGAEGLFYDYVMKSRLFDPMSEWSAHLYEWWHEKTYHIDSYRESGLFDVDAMLRDFQPTDLERRLMSDHDLVPGQILWRRIKRASLLSTGALFEQEYPENLNDCFLAAGECYFVDSEFDHINYYRTEMIHAPAFVLTSLSYGANTVEFRGGMLNVWEAPVPGKSYVAWLDTATGQSEDYSTIGVLDVAANHVVAALRVRTTPERSGAMACAVGHYYNNAFLGIERNSYGLSALSVALNDLRYPNLYYDIVNEPSKPSCGWYTSSANRDKMLGGLRAAFFGHTLIFHDAVALMEMGAFTWQKAGNSLKAQARTGAHDDMVMTLAGLLAIAPYAPKRTVSLTGGDSQVAQSHQNWMM